MNLLKTASFCLLGLALAALYGCTSNKSTTSGHPRPPGADLAQVPSWSKADMDFFLHGSMSTEIIPEKVLQAFILTYPEVFPTSDFSHLGAIPDPSFGWPVGFSRTKVSHLANQPSIGINCAACHVGEISTSADAPRVRVLGMTSHFDAEAFFGSILTATFLTQNPTNMHRFLVNYLVVNGAQSDGTDVMLLNGRWAQQADRIKAALAADPGGSEGLTAGALNKLAADDLKLNHEALADNSDLAALSHSFLRLFHNTRTCLHFPDQAPDPTKLPPPSGPGRNDAFGLLSAVLFGTPQPYAPVKYGLVWNVDQRHWVHWDGNTQSPLGRNLLASVGLGAPLMGKHAEMDFAKVKHQTDLSEKIHAPKYPWSIDAAMAARGAVQFEAKCASCHGGAESDARLYSPSEIGTQPDRAVNFTRDQADHFDTFLATLETPGYKPSDVPGIRSTQKYWAASLQGVWARSPYLHNGSVRTMAELLTPPADRAKSFHRGSRIYDAEQMGYTDAGLFVLDTGIPANDRAGHNYGTDLDSTQKRELIEYLKTL